MGLLVRRGERGYREGGRKYKRMSSLCCTQDFPNRSIKPIVWFPPLHCPLVVESHCCFDRKMIVKKTSQNRNKRQPHSKELPVSMELVGSFALHELPVL